MVATTSRVVFQFEIKQNQPENLQNNKTRRYVLNFSFTKMALFLAQYQPTPTKKETK